MGSLPPEGAVPLRRPGTRLDWTDGEPTVVDVEAEQAHRLNATALALWELCDGETTVGEMIDAASLLFDEDPRVVRRDVLAAFEQFARANLLVWPTQGNAAVPNLR